MTGQVVVHRIRLKRREQPETLQSHWLVPVALNNRGPFLFAVEPSRYKTLVAATTIEGLGISLDNLPNSLLISEKLAFPLVRLQSLAVAEAVLNDFEVVAWGRPVIPPETMAEMREDKLYWLGKDPPLPIQSLLECRGVLGWDFLHNFKVSLDFHTDTLMLEG